MATLRERLRAMQDENRKREAECEGLKRERDDLLKRLEGHQLQPSVTPQAPSVMMSLHTIIAGIIEQRLKSFQLFSKYTLLNNYIKVVTLRGWLGLD